MGFYYFTCSISMLLKSVHTVIPLGLKFIWSEPTPSSIMLCMYVNRKDLVRQS